MVFRSASSVLIGKHRNSADGKAGARMKTVHSNTQQTQQVPVTDAFGFHHATASRYSLNPMPSVSEPSLPHAHKTPCESLETTKAHLCRNVLFPMFAFAPAINVRLAVTVSTLSTG